MIFDKIENLKYYAALLPGIQKITAYIEKGDIDYSGGAVHLDGDKLYVSPFKGTGRARHEARLEAHHRYIDLQLLMKGNEEIGWSPLSDCNHEAAPYNDENDIVFFNDPVRDYLKLNPGYFTIFFPEDAHAPLVGGEIQKLIFKILIV